ncbi:Pycsar system effector family protein [Sphingomonas montanisoli]|uniref:Pycsar effector protein domain-containing protein n=1 Tax=Sphingomonas montanisoli TaxID=2606412 RepID=A0A5D9CGX5_9SPHN|nr:Pycsar system effector family protein [Sphingomonas montanisoli]TZG29335.1 hypothetical protein FYJ91_04215 [Sphingomonas montanisoli]
MSRDDEPPRPKPKGTFAPDAVHLLRTTQQIQYQLSQMADQKASMLMGATFVIFTITIGMVKSDGGAPLALLVLGASAFVAALLAVLAVLPSTKVPPKADGPANMLFFGSFTQLTEEQYVQMILDSVGDSDVVYAAFAHDIYQNGRVLARKKYRLLGYAYRVLLGGLIFSFVLFVGHFVINY